MSVTLRVAWSSIICFWTTLTDCAMLSRVVLVFVATEVLFE